MLVIVGHQIQYSSGNPDVFCENPVFKFIYGFHMSLFMIVSGYFFYSTCSKHSAKDIVVNRIRQCLVPIVTFTIISQLIKWDLPPVSFVSSLTNNLWFLWTVLSLSVLLLFVFKQFPNLWGGSSCCMSGCSLYLIIS